MRLFGKLPEGPRHVWGKWEIQEFFIEEIVGWKKRETYNQSEPIIYDRQLQRRSCERCGLTQEMSVDDENNPDNGVAGDCIG